MVKFTRKQYLQGACSHQDYYMQFATPAVIARVKSKVDLIVLLSSKEDGFRDVYSLPFWDNAIGTISRDVGEMMREAGDHPTLAGSVCLAKAVARSLISE